MIITDLLHDVGIKIAEEKYNSAAGNYQEIRGPAVATQSMIQNHEPEDTIRLEDYIIGGHYTAAKNDDWYSDCSKRVSWVSLNKLLPKVTLQTFY